MGSPFHLAQNLGGVEWKDVLGQPSAQRNTFQTIYPSQSNGLLYAGHNEPLRLSRVSCISKGSFFSKLASTTNQAQPTGSKIQATNRRLQITNYCSFQTKSIDYEAVLEV